MTGTIETPRWAKVIGFLGIILASCGEVRAEGVVVQRSGVPQPKRGQFRSFALEKPHPNKLLESDA